MACCKRLAGGNHLYIYIPRTQPGWTTLQTLCRKCTESENPIFERFVQMKCLTQRCLCEDQGQIQLSNRPSLQRIRKQNYNKTITKIFEIL